MTKTDDGLPSKIDNLGEVSSNARLIYVERADGRYDLSNAGKRLKTVRSALASGGHIPTVPIDGNPFTLL